MYFFFQAEDGIRDTSVTGVQTCALTILSRRHRRQREENCGDQAPENSNRARNAQAGKRRISRKSERTETAHRGQSRKQDRFYHTGDIVLDLTCLLPDQHNVYPVVNADRQHQTERKHIQQIEIDMQQLHRSDHSSDAERECDHLDQPQTKIAIQKRQQRYVEYRHERADDKKLMMRPWLEIRERKAPA